MRRDTERGYKLENSDFPVLGLRMLWPSDQRGNEAARPETLRWSNLDNRVARLQSPLLSALLLFGPRTSLGCLYHPRCPPGIARHFLGRRGGLCNHSVLYLESRLP